MFQDRPEIPTSDEQTRRLAEQMGINPEELTRRKQEVAAAVKALQAGSNHRGGGNGRHAWRPGEHFRWRQGKRSEDR